MGRIRQAKRVPEEDGYVQPPKSDAKTHRTPKALRAKCVERFFSFRAALGVRARPRAYGVRGDVRALKSGDMSPHSESTYVRKLTKGSSRFAIALGVRTACPPCAGVLAPLFDFTTPWAFFIGTFPFHIHVMRTIRARCVSFFC
jgi:hypothetical protein